MKIAKILSLAGVLAMTAMMILGFFAGALYVFIHLYTSKGDWHKFFFGHRLKT